MIRHLVIVSDIHHRSVLAVMTTLVIHLHEGPRSAVQRPRQLLVSPEGPGEGDGPLGGVPHPGVGGPQDVETVIVQGRREADRVSQQLGRQSAHYNPTSQLLTPTVVITQLIEGVCMRMLPLWSRFEF